MERHEHKKLLRRIDEAYKEGLDPAEKAWLRAARRRHRDLTQGEW